MKKYSLVFALLASFSLAAQSFSPGFSFYAEAYAGFDPDQPLSRVRAPFMYNHHRLNEASLNLVQAEFAHLSAEGRVRAKIGLQAGTYVERNLAAEPPALRYLSESFVGFCTPKQKLWIDMGIFNSHIGFEGVKGIDNDMLTRTLMAENSPYYEAGARALYKGSKVDLGLYLLNGWQQIRNNGAVRTGPSIGTQLQWKAGRLTFNSSAFAGILAPRPVFIYRIFHNFWMNYTSASQKHKLTFAFDAGYQVFENAFITRTAFWNVQSLVYRWNVSQHWSATARIEHFHDPEGVFITQPVNFAFGGRVLVGALGAEYRVHDDFCVRAEARYMKADEKFFEHSSPGSATTLPLVRYADHSISGVFAICYRIPPIQVVKEKQVPQQ
ncbi:MAG: porin [Bacteroidetes bacterium]|nr:porin [Bacteroidota bacterium]